MKVMVSYRAPDRTLAVEVYTFLKQAGHAVWIDQDMRTGAQWRVEFLDKVRTSDICVPIITSSYLQSEHCRLELFVARSYGQKIFHVMAEDCWADLEKYEETKGLSRIQGIKLYNMRSVGLPISKDEMLGRLARALQDPNRHRRYGVYVSFFSENAVLATAIARQLISENIPTWIATLDATVGMDWRNEQAHAMLSSACHLVLMRPGVTKNEFLKTEAMLSEAAGIPLYTALEPEFADEQSIAQLNAELRDAEITFRRLFDRQAFRINQGGAPLKSAEVEVLRKEVKRRSGWRFPWRG